MKIWGIRYHHEETPELYWEAPRGTRLIAFAASAKGAFVIVESEACPRDGADLLICFPDIPDHTTLTDKIKQLFASV